MGFQNDLLRIVAIIAMFLNVAIIFFALYLGWKMGTASDEGKRKEAKKRLFNTIVSFVLVLMMIGILRAVDFIGDDHPLTGNQIHLSIDHEAPIAANSSEVRVIIQGGDGSESQQRFRVASNNATTLNAIAYHIYIDGEFQSTQIRLVPGVAGTALITIAEDRAFGQVWQVQFTVA